MNLSKISIYLHHSHHPILTHFRMKRSKTLIKIMTKNISFLNLIREKNSVLTLIDSWSFLLLLVKKHNDNGVLALTKYNI